MLSHGLTRQLRQVKKIARCSCNSKVLITWLSRCAMWSDQPTGMSKFWDSSDATKRCGMESPPSSAREIPQLRCFPQIQMQAQHLYIEKISECCISLFARTGKIFLVRSTSLKSAASNSNSKITKFRTRSIFAIPTATISRSRLTISRDAHSLL
jgi:hypothetical protein